MTNEKERYFREALQEFLDRWGAEMTVGDDGQPYGWQQGQVIITLKRIEDFRGNCVRDFTEFVL